MTFYRRVIKKFEHSVFQNLRERPVCRAITTVQRQASRVSLHSDEDDEHLDLRNSRYASERSSLSVEEDLNTIAFPFLAPDPNSKIAVHGGYKVQAALIIHRVPLHYEEPAYRREFRLFREQWRLSTGNDLTIDDNLLYMKLPTHFYRDSTLEDDESLSRTDNTALMIPPPPDPSTLRLQKLLNQETVVLPDTMDTDTQDFVSNIGVFVGSS